MPIVDDDNSRIQMETSYNIFKKVLRMYPEYTSQLHPNLWSYIDLNKSTRGGIKVYQFNKIRMKVDQIKRKHGYMVRWGYKVGFVAHLMISVPQNTLIDYYETDQHWKQYVSHRWRVCQIFDVQVEGSVQGNLAIVFSSLLGVVGLGGIIPDIIKGNTIRNYSIFENLVTYGGMHNIFILSNWDKILPMLNKAGF